MATEYTLVQDLPGMLASIQPQGIVSRTFFRGDRLKAVLFGFDAGQELSEHTSSQSAVVQILDGQATVTVGEDTFELGPGSWLHMEPRTKHSVMAKTPVVMLLSMFTE